MQSATNNKEIINDNCFISIEEHHSLITIKDCEIESQNHQIQLLQEKIHYLLYQRFGQKSERFDGQQQLPFENDNDEPDEIEPITEIAVPAHTRKKGGRRIPPKNLPHTGGTPAKQVQTVQGLNHVLEYLDAMRGKI